MVHTFKSLAIIMVMFNVIVMVMVIIMANGHYHSDDQNPAQARVSDVVHTAKTGWILSGGRDKYFHYHCVNTGPLCFVCLFQIF